MSKREDQDETFKVPDSKTSFVIMGTIADTTWRMFTPVLVLLLVGWWLDNKFHTKPWLVLTGVFVGFGLAIGLIWLQYRQAVKGKGTKDSE